MDAIAYHFHYNVDIDIDDRYLIKSKVSGQPVKLVTISKTLLAYCIKKLISQIELNIITELFYDIVH